MRGSSGGSRSTPTEPAAPSDRQARRPRQRPGCQVPLLSSWTLLEELAESHTRRLARTVDDYVNAAEYDAGEEQPATRPRLLAAV